MTTTLNKHPKKTPPPAPERRQNRLWSLFLAVPTGWLALFYLVPLLILVGLSFGATDLLGNPVYAWNPGNYADLASSLYAQLFARSLLYSLCAVAICLLIGYPVAYTIAMYGGRYKYVLIGLVALTLLVNYLVRIYSWTTLLSDQGLVPYLFSLAGLPAPQLMNTPTAVIGGLVYGYIVFMIIPVFVAVERMDKTLVEAGRDLYGNRMSTFGRVTLPATRKGVVNGSLLVFLPTMGDFISSELLGGSSTAMIGNVISDQFTTGLNWPLGAALTVLLLAILAVIVVVFMRLASPRRERRSA